jgi:hypothetical protein
VSFTSSVLRGVGAVKMLGLANHLASRMHTLRVHEMSLSKKFRLLTCSINMVGTWCILFSVSKMCMPLT